MKTLKTHVIGILILSLSLLMGCDCVSTVYGQEPVSSTSDVQAKITVNTLIDSAVDKLPPLRKRVMQRILKNNRAEMVDLVAIKLADHPACKECASTFDSPSFDGNTALAINPDNLKIVLDFLTKLIPILIQLFFKV